MSHIYFGPDDFDSAVLHRRRQALLHFRIAQRMITALGSLINTIN
jgi:hypothetical protein